MEWTHRHDSMLCREILASEPYKFKARTVERGKVWDEIAERLNNIKDPKFKVSKRSIREHFQLLVAKYKTKRSTENRASGIEVEDTEVDEAMEDICEKMELAEEEQLKGADNKRRKIEADKVSAEEVRLRATEKLGETKTRNDSDEGCTAVKPKKSRRSGTETVEFLRLKSEKDHEFRQQELGLREKEQENQQKLQQQQLEMMRMMQQQNQSMMVMMSKLINK